MTRLCVLLLFVSAAARAGAVSFHRFVLGNEGQNGIYSEDLDGNGRRDIIGLALGRISIYRADPNEETGYSATPEVLVTGPTAYYADVADVRPEKGKEILILTPTGVDCFVHDGDHFNPRPVPLLKCDTVLSMNAVHGGVALGEVHNVPVLPWNFALDANADGLDDVLVPNDKGTDIYLQKPAGHFGKPLTLGLVPLVYHFAAPGHKADEFRLLTSRSVRLQVIVPGIERRDVNNDGRPDLVCGRYWFAQKADGTFDPSPAEVPRDLLNEPERAMRRMDINGDGRKDGIAEETDPQDLLNIITRVRVFLADAEGRLPAEPNQTLAGQNILIQDRLPVHDFNHDGALDFAMFKTDISVTEIGKWVRQNFGKIDGDLNFYLFDKKANAYNRRPSFKKYIVMSFKVDPMEALMGLVWERYLSTMMRFEGDYNGDGLLDLLVREETNTLAIYLNTGDPVRLYRNDPDIVLKHLPNFGGLALNDLNGDGADDIMLYAGNYDSVLAAYISRRH